MFKLPKTNIYFGSKLNVNEIHDKSEYCIVHFCKSFFDTQKSNVFYKNNSDLKLFENELFVNISDSENQNDFNLNTFNQILKWIDQNSKNKKIFIHCDWGQSRSPSLVLLYSSKFIDNFPKDFYSSVEIIQKIQPEFVYPSGITKFIKTNWDKFISN